MTHIGYARVSSEEQQTNLQIDALQIAGCSRVFQEKASGALRDREQLKAALAYMREGDTLVVWKLDRLARSVSHLIETVEDLHRRGCGFRSLTEAIDTTSPSGKLIFHVFAALAEFERSIIRERTIAGLTAARARGRAGGRPKVLTNEKRAAVAALLKDENLTIRQIARQVGISSASVYKEFPHPRSRKGCVA